MKCLSVKQPYAEFIVKGLKTIELRSWNTSYRGELLIHASAVPDPEGIKRFNIDESSIQKGAIIGKVFLYGVKEYPNTLAILEDKDRHLAGEAYVNKSKFGFLLREAKAITPIKAKGSLGIYEVNLGGVSYA